MLNEDLRAAANMTVTLSTQLMTASLALLAVEGAIFTFANDKRTPGGGFTISVGLCFLFLMASLYMGGRGINKVRKAVAAEDWSINKVRDEFAWQAVLGFLGLMCLILSLFLTGKPKEENMQQDLTNMKTMIEKQQQVVNGLEKQLGELRDQIKNQSEPAKNQDTSPKNQNAPEASPKPTLR